MKQFEISVLFAALAIGAAAGWFAAGLANPSTEAATAQPNATARPALDITLKSFVFEGFEFVGEKLGRFFVGEVNLDFARFEYSL